VLLNGIGETTDVSADELIRCTSLAGESWEHFDINYDLMASTLDGSFVVIGTPMRWDGEVGMRVDPSRSPESLSFRDYVALALRHLS